MKKFGLLIIVFVSLSMNAYALRVTDSVFISPSDNVVNLGHAI